MLTNAKDESDHPWHLGSWFCFIALNKVPTWSAKNAVHVKELEFHPRDDFSAEIKLTIDYGRRPGEPALREIRDIHVSPPTLDGDYAITSRHRFRAVDEPVTARKNYYGGFACRLGRDLKGKWRFFNAGGEVKGRTTKGKELSGAPSPWMCFSNHPDGPAKGIALFDHPGNPGFPNKWFCSPNYPFFNVVFPYLEDHGFQPGEELELKYQALVFAGKDDLGFLQNRHRQFAAEDDESRQ